MVWTYQTMWWQKLIYALNLQCVVLIIPCCYILNGISVCIVWHLFVCVGGGMGICISSSFKPSPLLCVLFPSCHWIITTITHLAPISIVILDDHLLLPALLKPSPFELVGCTLLDMNLGLISLDSWGILFEGCTEKLSANKDQPKLC